MTDQKKSNLIPLLTLCFAVLAFVFSAFYLYTQEKDNLDRRVTVLEHREDKQDQRSDKQDLRLDKLETSQNIALTDIREKLTQIWVVVNSREAIEHAREKHAH